MSADLAKLEVAEQLLAEIATVPDAANVADYAEAARVYAREAKLGAQAENHATRIKLKAERRLAGLVDEGQAAGQIAGQGKVRTADVSSFEDLGISKQRIAEARKIRDNFTEEQIDEKVAEANEQNQTVSRRQFVKPEPVRDRALEWAYAHDDDGSLARSKWNVAFSKSVARSLNGLIGWKTEQILEQCYPEDLESLLGYQRSIDAWFDRLRKGRPTGLRMVEGGQK